MEEWIGWLWHRIITKAANDTYPDAAVSLDEMRHEIGVVFRALGGDSSLSVENATAIAQPGSRKWLQRIAGRPPHGNWCWRDQTSIRLPDTIAVYPSGELNRDLYFWLAAQASARVSDYRDWFAANQQRTLWLLHHWPGLKPRYHRLVNAELTRRVPPERLPPVDSALEQQIRVALTEPARRQRLPVSHPLPEPVLLWLYPSPTVERRPPRSACDEDQQQLEQVPRQTEITRKKRRGEHVDEPDERSGLMAFRLESLFSWTEFVNVDRTGDDDDDDHAEQRADDLDVLTLSKSRGSVAARVRFDLDLPAPINDDRPLGEGVLLPEWDCRQRRLVADYCRVQPLVADPSTISEQNLPTHLERTASELRRQFESLKPSPAWLRRQFDGCDLDLDAWVEYCAQKAQGKRQHSNQDESRFYREYRRQQRDLACLLLADCSLSTDSWIDNNTRVIDTIRDSLFLFSEVLSTLRDRFALYGFSTRRREHIRIHALKTFNEPYDTRVAARIHAIKPGYYTRMGAALRYATMLLRELSAEQRVLLLLTDGKPNDLDRYEGHYGIEDTRVAVLEAKRAGLRPFCVTIDQEGERYLPTLFGNNGFIVIRKPADLPHRLPLLYANLTG